MSNKPKRFGVLVLVVEPEKAEHLANALAGVDGVIGTVDVTISTVQTSAHINFLPIRIGISEEQP